MLDAFGRFVYYYVMNGTFGTYTIPATDGVNSTTTTLTETKYHLEAYKSACAIYSLY